MATKYAPGVDVVVVNYQSPEDIFAFIQTFALVQYEVPCSLTIINVDPGEEDDRAVDMAVRSSELTIPTIWGSWPRNVGYAHACNFAAASLNEYLDHPPRATVAFFNADTRLRSGVLDACHWELHQHKDWAVCGPRQIDDYGKITHAGIFGTMERPQLRGWQEPDEGQFNEIRDDAVSVSGSAYFAKRKVWDALTACPLFCDIVGEKPAGAFLPTQHYYEETWCSYHALAHGHKVAYMGSVVMTHRWHKASPSGGPADQEMSTSQAAFRSACDQHGIPHD